jgi:hypothetical protein
MPLITQVSRRSFYDHHRSIGFQIAPRTDMLRLLVQLGAVPAIVNDRPGFAAFDIEAAVP